jgi:hypothetical protein
MDNGVLSCPYCVFITPDQDVILKHIRDHIKEKEEMTLNQLLKWLKMKEITHGDKLVVQLRVKE